MNALVLNGSENENDEVCVVSDYLVDILRTCDNTVDVVPLRDERIAACMGCFGCWLKTPGKCVIKDAASGLPQRILQSDVLFLLTPVIFGMYSPELKKAMDRYACPLLLPFFTKINGEVHHAQRYEKRPTIIAIGVLPEPDEESENVFTTLVMRNGLNLSTKTLSTFVYSSDKPDMVKQKVMSTLSKAGVQ